MDAAPMIPEWFVLSNNQPVGPYTQEQLLGLIQQGSVAASSYVRRLDGPWVLAGQAYALLATQAMPPPIPAEVISPGPAISLPQTVASSSTTRYPRKKSGSFVSTILFVAMVLIGGAAGIYVAKTYVLLPQQAAQQSLEPEIIVIPAPQRPAVATLPDDRTRGKVAPPSVVEPRPAVPEPRITGSIPPRIIEPSNPKADPAVEAWRTKAVAMLRRRDEIRSEIENAAPSLQQSLDEQTLLQGEFGELKEQPRNFGFAISKAIGDRNALTQALPLSNDPGIASQISQLNSGIADLQARKAAIDERQRLLQPKLAQASAAALSKQNRQNRLLAEADRLRAEFLFHAHPAVIKPPAVLAEAVRLFGGLQAKSEPLDKGWGLFGQACIALVGDDHKAAEQKITEAINVLPNEAAFRALRGSWLARVDRIDEAVTDAVESFKAHPENWSVNFFGAQVYLRRGNFLSLKLAETRLKKCRELDPQGVLAPIVMSLMKSASAEEKFLNASYALKLAHEAFDLEASHVTQFTLALAFAENGNYADALRHAQEAIKAADLETAGWYGQCLTLLEAKKPVRIDWKQFDLWQFSY
ncbi:MAG: DUF4339 domain-containing protein [Planctomycetes bacterium]|nr:DUF4339 domain-containing protein [Planctomycetota bacterium]